MSGQKGFCISTGLIRVIKKNLISPLPSGSEKKKFSIFKENSEWQK